MMGSLALLQGSIMRWNISDEVLSDVEADVSALNFLRNSLYNAYPYTWKRISREIDEKDKRRYSGVMFLGLEDEITVLTPLPVHHQTGGMVLMRFFVRNHNLQVGYRSVIWDDAEATYEEEEEKVEVLMEHVASIKFSYFSRRLRENDARITPRDWQEEWEENNSLPDVVRVHITRRNNAQEGLYYQDYPQMYISMRGRNSNSYQDLSFGYDRY